MRPKPQLDPLAATPTSSSRDPEDKPYARLQRLVDQCQRPGVPGVQDFALEADESRMRNGAHLMAGSLSGSLALVTGREPLRHSLASQLRLMLANALEPPALESTIAVRPCPAVLSFLFEQADQAGHGPTGMG